TLRPAASVAVTLPGAAVPVTARGTRRSVPPGRLTVPVPAFSTNDVALKAGCRDAEALEAACGDDAAGIVHPAASSATAPSVDRIAIPRLAPALPFISFAVAHAGTREGDADGQGLWDAPSGCLVHDSKTMAIPRSVEATCQTHRNAG